MTWVRLEDKFPRHRKVADLSDRAFRVYVMGLCLCAEELTDGHISDRNVRVIGALLDERRPGRVAQELVDADLWGRNGSGYVIPNYLEYQPSRSEVESKREATSKARAEAGRKGGVQSGASRRAKREGRQT